VPGARVPADWYVGFDCRRCSSQIPVYRVVAEGQGTRDPPLRLIVMCPHCGYASSYDGGEAYRFVHQNDAAGLAAAGGAE
jgi:hypothetical protein